MSCFLLFSVREKCCSCISFRPSTISQLCTFACHPVTACMTPAIVSAAEPLVLPFLCLLCDTVEKRKQIPPIKHVCERKLHPLVRFLKLKCTLTSYPSLAHCAQGCCMQLCNNVLGAKDDGCQFTRIVVILHHVHCVFGFFFAQIQRISINFVWVAILSN